MVSGQIVWFLTRVLLGFFKIRGRQVGYLAYIFQFLDVNLVGVLQNPYSFFTLQFALSICSPISTQPCRCSIDPRACGFLELPFNVLKQCPKSLYALFHRNSSSYLVFLFFIMKHVTWILLTFLSIVCLFFRGALCLVMN